MSSPLTLCYIADISNHNIRRWLSFFVRRGHHVYCLSDKEGSLEGVTVYPLPNRETLRSAGVSLHKTAVLRARAAAVRQYLVEIKPDVLHAHFLYMRGWTAALTDFHPLVMTLLGSDIYLPQANYRNKLHLLRDRLLNRLALAQADLITGVSARLCGEARKMVGSAVPVELIPIGTDIKIFGGRVYEGEVEALRHRLNIQPDDFVIFSPRAMTPLYNIETIVESIPHVLAKIPHAVFLLKDTVGPIAEERQAYISQLQEQVAALGVAHAVRWAFEVPYEELPNYYHLSHAVVSVPSSDGMPVTLFEAMASGVPVVVGDLPSYDEVVIPEKTGLRVPVQDPKALAVALIRLAEARIWGQSLADEARKVVERLGDFEGQLERMEGLYAGLQGAPRRARPGWSRVLLEGLVTYL